MITKKLDSSILLVAKTNHRFEASKKNNWEAAINRSVMSALEREEAKEK